MVEEPESVLPSAAGAEARYGAAAGRAEVRRYTEIDVAAATRVSSGYGEFDRVLGGGIVPGSMVLVGGEPGIGKSTLLLQVAARVAATAGPVLYASGEESEQQVKERGERLDIGDPALFLLAETCLERLLEAVERVRPALLVVDSIQTIVLPAARFGPRQRGAGARSRDPPAVQRQARQPADHSRRPRHEGWEPGRSEGAGARGGHGALLRGGSATMRTAWCGR